MRQRIKDAISLLGAVIFLVAMVLAITTS